MQLCLLVYRFLGLLGERERQVSQLSGQRQGLTAQLADLERQEQECQKILA